MTGGLSRAKTYQIVLLRKTLLAAIWGGGDSP